MQTQIIPLPSHGLLKVQGPDAKKLLQGQLTCDVEKITAITNGLGAHCNTQGRIISFFRLFYFQDAYFLLMSRSMMSSALAALKKYAVFYKLELADVSEQFTITGCIGTSNHPEKKNQYQIKITSSTPRYLLIDEAPDFSNSHSSTLPETYWKNLDLSDRIPSIYPTTSEKFLPHELNLPTLDDCISFNKGCYTGQEIIARLQYRGKLKSELYIANILCDAAPTPGEDIFCLQNNSLQTQGNVVDFCQVGHHEFRMLIVVNQAHAKSEHLFLHSNQQRFFTLEKN